MDWHVAELLGYAYYAERGYRVLAPLVRNDGYDFVAEKDGQFIRVNVKMAGLKDKNQPNSWAISKASGAAANTSNVIKTACDVFLVYVPVLSMFVELPGTFLDGGNSKSKRLPKELVTT